MSFYKQTVPGEESDSTLGGTENNLRAFLVVLSAAKQ